MNSREGIFHAAAMLVQDPQTDTYSLSRVNDLMAWFSENLQEPERFSKSNSKAFYRRNTKGLSWFKESAKAHIAKAFELKSVLEENGYVIEVLKNNRVGYIVYEDDQQLVAEPFSDTTT